MTRYAPFAAALAIIIGVGLIHNNWTESWPWPRHKTDEVQVFTERLADVPMEFGDWIGKDVEANEEELKIANVSGVVQREYHNRLDPKKTVQMFLVSGRSRNIAVHTPDKCYPANGFKMAPEGPQTHPVDYGIDEQAKFYYSRFSKDDSSQSTHLRVLWTWNGSAGWEAPWWPKVQLARHKALYKLYVISSMKRPNDPIAQDPSIEFLEEFLTVLAEALFPEEAALKQAALDTAADATGD